MSVDFSLILPCYNEEKNIKILFQEFIDLPRQNNNKFELILLIMDQQMKPSWKSIKQFSLVEIIKRF